MMSTIEIKIDSARKETEALVKKEYTWQQEVDSFLDRINELGGLLSDIHKLLLTITFEVERDFTNFKKSESGQADIKRMSNAVSKMLMVVRRSDLFPGVKNTYYSLKTENNYLKELLSDGKVGNELDSDPEMAEIVKKSLEAIKKL